MAERTSCSNDNAGSSACLGDGVRTNIHSGVSKAVRYMWNNQYNDALNVMIQKKHLNPRYAVEWANLSLVRSLMTSTNEDRERLLHLFKEADSLASGLKYHNALFSDDDSESQEDDSDRDNVAAEGAEGESAVKHEVANGGEHSGHAHANHIDHRHSHNSHPHTTAVAQSSLRVSNSERKKNKKMYQKKIKLAHVSQQSLDYIWKLECDVCYADALLMRSICQLMMNSYLKGGLNLRKAWGAYHTLMQTVLKDIHHKIPREMCMCIKYGVGVFYAFLSLVPASLMKMLSVIGFISDKELGEQYLTEVFESNTIRSPFAALVLCTLYLFLPTGLGNVEITLAKAKHIIDIMNERYPNNTYFHGYANFYYRKKGCTQAAVDSITLACDNAEKAGLVPLLIKYLYADTLFMDQQWELALKQYEAVLDHLHRTHEKFAYTGQVVLSTAACYVMLGQFETAKLWVRKVGIMYNPKSKNDASSPKFATRVLANPQLLPLAGVYMLYINRDLAHMTKEQGQRVLSELERVIKGQDISGSEASSMYNLFVGVIHAGCGDTDEAVKYLKATLRAEASVPSNSMIMPFTYYELGLIEYRLGNKHNALNLFVKGQKLKGDGNETLSNRYRIALKQLKAEMHGK